ncbi:hypothetical protein [Amphibacillus sediminis]|uniref:hypothetical protein n=1 Tax=Amphibacillus sediminis TaxID=360185 RepID=UPI0012EE015F|nr:hypothetical protein [Amphibacillus sediminis]
MSKRTLFMVVSLFVLFPFVYINAEETLTSTDVSTIGQKRSFTPLTKNTKEFRMDE